MNNIIKDFFKDFKTQLKNAKKDGIKKQIPNILTASRALAPIFTIPLLLKNKITAASIVIAIFAITDFFDGRIARKYNCVSEFGVKLDAVCDKFFVLGITLPAILKNKLLIIILFIELLISIVNLLSEAKGNNARSIMVGKIKTGILSITLVLTYLSQNKKLILFISIVTIIMQIITLTKYIIIDHKKDIEKKKK